MAFLQGAQHWGLFRGAGAAENRREDGQCGGVECGGVPHPRQRVSIITPTIITFVPRWISIM